MSKLLVVTGATGMQGSAILKYFQEHQPTYKLRGLTRNPSSDAATAVAATGVEIVKADFNDVASLIHAFAGASVIYAYTDFPSLAFGPDAEAEEVRQGKNIADAAATVPELERLIWNSLTSITKCSKGKYPRGYYFDTKARITEYMLEHEGLQGKVSMLMLGQFATNARKFPGPAGFSKGTDGTLIWTQRLSGEHVVPYVDVESDVGAFVEALIEAPAGTHVVGASEDMTNKQFLEMLCKHLGREGEYRNISLEEAVKGDTTGWMTMQSEIRAFCEDFGFTGGDPSVVTPEQLENILGRRIPRSSIEDFVKRSDWSKMEAL